MNGRTFLQALLDARGLNPHSFGKKIGNASLQSTVQRYLGGTTKESRRSTLQPVADFFGVDVAAFFDPDKARAELVRLNIPFSERENADDGRHTPVIQNVTEGNAEPAGSPRKIWPVRIRGTAKLGDDGYYEVTEGDGWVDSYSSNPDAYGLRVKGDSMHPAIRNGSVVVVEPGGQLIPTEYVAIALKDGKKMVKELVVERPDEVVVESVNGNKRQTIARSDILQIDPVAAVVSPSKWRPER